MPVNVLGALDVPLEDFGGLNTQLSAPDIPEGVSPDNQDVAYNPGEVFSREGLARELPVGGIPNTPTILFEDSFATATGDDLTLLIDAYRRVWVEDVSTGVLTNPFEAARSVQKARGKTAFKRKYLAGSDGKLGAEIPIQFDGTNWRRFTQDGPGSNPCTLTNFSAALPIVSIVVPPSISPLQASQSSDQVGISVMITTGSLLAPVAHGFNPGDWVILSGFMTNTALNALWQVQAVPTPSSLTIAFLGAFMGNEGINGTKITSAAPVLTTSIGAISDTSLVPGDLISIAGTSVSAYNNRGTIDIPPTWRVLEVLDLAPLKFTFLYDQATPPPAGTSSGGTANGGGIVDVGNRQMVFFFITDTGYETRPSPPIPFLSNGGNRIQVDNIPIGPPNVIARGFAFTGVDGGNFFTIPTVPTAVINGSIQPIGTSLIIPDNTTTTAVFDFSDATLLSSSAIDIPGNNLFALVPLGPIAGIDLYAGRMFAWGEYNRIINFKNMGFEGGAAALEFTYTISSVTCTDNGDSTFTGTVVLVGSQVVPVGIVNIMGNALFGANGAFLVTSSAAGTFTFIGNGVTTGSGIGGTVTNDLRPLGWGGNAAFGQLVSIEQNLGMAWQFRGVGNSGIIGKLFQGAYQDEYGVAIVEPNTTYMVQMRLSANGDTSSGAVHVQLVTNGSTIVADATFPLNQYTANVTMALVVMSGPTPAVIPADLILQVNGLDVPDGCVVRIDELSLIPTDDPTFDNFAVSYVNNPESFDSVTGVLGSTNDQSLIMTTSKIRDVLYFRTLGKQTHSTEDNNIGEPATWTVREVSNSVGAVSLAATASGEEWDVTADRAGLYLFDGRSPVKISQEIQRIWNSINWNAADAVWVVNDIINRRIYVGAPFGAFTQPNQVLMMDYQGNDTGDDVAASKGVRVSYSGKLIASEYARKWTRWNVYGNCGEILTRQSGPKFCMGAGNGLEPLAAPGFGQIYSLDAAKLTDDDYGTIVPYYVTYGFISKDVEQQFGTGLHMLTFKMMAMFISGTGQVKVTPYVNALTNQLNALPQRTLDSNPIGDVELPVNINAETCFLKIASLPASGQTDNGFRLNRVTLAMSQYVWAPVRGALV